MIKNWKSLLVPAVSIMTMVVNPGISSSDEINPNTLLLNELKKKENQIVQAAGKNASEFYLHGIEFMSWSAGQVTWDANTKPRFERLPGGDVLQSVCVPDSTVSTGIATTLTSNEVFQVTQNRQIANSVGAGVQTSLTTGITLEAAAGPYKAGANWSVSNMVHAETSHSVTKTSGTSSSNGKTESVAVTGSQSINFSCNSGNKFGPYQLHSVAEVWKEILRDGNTNNPAKFSYTLEPAQGAQFRPILKRRGTANLRVVFANKKQGEVGNSYDVAPGGFLQLRDAQIPNWANRVILRYGGTGEVSAKVYKENSKATKMCVGAGECSLPWGNSGPKENNMVNKIDIYNSLGEETETGPLLKVASYDGGWAGITVEGTLRADGTNKSTATLIPVTVGIWAMDSDQKKWMIQKCASQMGISSTLSQDAALTKMQEVWDAKCDKNNDLERKVFLTDNFWGGCKNNKVKFDSGSKCMPKPDLSPQQYFNFYGNKPAGGKKTGNKVTCHPNTPNWNQDMMECRTN